VGALFSFRQRPRSRGHWAYPGVYIPRQSDPTFGCMLRVPTWSGRFGILQRTCLGSLLGSRAQSFLFERIKGFLQIRGGPQNLASGPRCDQSGRETLRRRAAAGIFFLKTLCPEVEGPILRRSSFRAVLTHVCVFIGPKCKCTVPPGGLVHRLSTFLSYLSTIFYSTCVGSYTVPLFLLSLGS